MNLGFEAELLAALPDISVYVLDDDLVMRFVSESPYWRTEDVIGKRPSDVSPGEAGQLLDRRYAAALAGEPQRFLYTSPVNGRRNLIQATRHASPLGSLLVIVQDVTDTYLAEHELLGARRRIETTFENAPSGMALVALDGTFLEVNPRFCELVGRTPEELARMPAGALVHPDDVDDAASALAALESGAATRLDVTRRYLHSDGAAVPLRITASLVRGDDDSSSYLLAHFEDMTAELALAEARHREGLATLAGGVAHDVNNLLQPMLASAELIRADADDDRTRSLASTIVSSARRAAHLTSQILAYAGEGAFSVREVDVAELVDELHGVTVEVAAELPRVRADAHQLRLLLENLVANAKEAGGKVHVSALHDDGAVRIAVTDTGGGIDEQVRGRIFEPFFSTKFAGRGMGLPAARGIAEANGGSLTVETETGRGTRITALLPAVDRR